MNFLKCGLFGADVWRLADLQAGRTERSPRVHSWASYKTNPRTCQHTKNKKGFEIKETSNTVEKKRRIFFVQKFDFFAKIGTVDETFLRPSGQAHTQKTYQRKDVQARILSWI